MIVTFLPAAGASRRMRGRDKLLEPVDGRPLLRRTAELALAAGLGPVLVGLRPGDAARGEALDALGIGRVDVPNSGDGLSATLRAGARAALDILPVGEPGGLLVHLPDMPDIARDDLCALARRFLDEPSTPVRALTGDGRPGLPVIFPAAMLPAFADLSGDRGAAALLEGQPVADVVLPGDRALNDLDTPEDWARWRGETEA